MGSVLRTANLLEGSEAGTDHGVSFLDSITMLSAQKLFHGQIFFASCSHNLIHVPSKRFVAKKKKAMKNQIS